MSNLCSSGPYRTEEKSVFGDEEDNTKEGASQTRVPRSNIVRKVYPSTLFRPSSPSHLLLARATVYDAARKGQRRTVPIKIHSRTDPVPWVEEEFVVRCTTTPQNKTSTLTIKSIACTSSRPGGDGTPTRSRLINFRNPLLLLQRVPPFLRRRSVGSPNSVVGLRRGPKVGRRDGTSEV